MKQPKRHTPTFWTQRSRVKCRVILQTNTMTDMSFLTCFVPMYAYTCWYKWSFQKMPHTYKDVEKRHLKATYITVDHWETLAQDRQQWRQAIHKGKVILKKIYHKNINMIKISAMAFLMLLPLSSFVSIAGEASNFKSHYSLTNEQSM